SVGSAVLVDGSTARVSQRMSAVPSMDPSNVLLTQYQSRVGDHLDKVALQLDEDIAAMRRKLKEDIAIIDKSNERKTILEKEISKYEMEKLEHDRLYEETLRKVADREEALIRDEMLLQTAKDRAQRDRATSECQELNLLGERFYDDLRIRLDSTNAKIAQLQLHLGGDRERRGTHRGLTRVWEKAREEGQRLAAEKNKQDAHIQQLRKDVAAADGALTKIRDEMNKEIESHEHSTKHAGQLRDRVTAFEEEHTIGEDHFGRLIDTLKERNASSAKTDSGTIRAIRDELVKTVTRIRKQYANLRQAKTGFVEDAESTDSDMEQLDGLQTSAALRCEMLQRQAAEMERLIAASADARSVGTRATRPKTVRPGGARTAHSGDSEAAGAQASKIQESNSVPKSSSIVNAAKSRNVAAKRRLSAMTVAKMRLTNTLDEAEERVAEEREEVKLLAQQLRKLEEEKIEVVKSKEKSAIDTVTVESRDSKEEQQATRKAAELREQRDLVDIEVRELQSQIEIEEQSLAELRKKLAPYEKMDVVAYEEERKGHAIELRRLKNYDRDLRKAIREKQKELSLSVVQRESAVDKANATLNLDTSVRVERKREVEEVQKQIDELEQELQTMGLSEVS
ncbi:hypothetical protein PFISCL1PPCAC_12927, partial [Pristionchus fissidentatus]